jgi:electron transport complex protein RnfG
MNEILKITTKLMITCIAAALVMGSVFAFTYSAKKHNEHLNEQGTMLGLLGYNENHKAPPDLRFHTIYRYIVAEKEKLFLGYLVPVRKDGKETFDLLLVTPEGQFADRFPVPINPEAASETAERDRALGRVLTPARSFTYSDSTIVATLGSARSAYLLAGKFRGFKTFIKVMLALDPSFNIVGLEIMESEEDPGLGAEIKTEYFKNQFRGKSFERIKTLDVVKEPLPDEFRKVLETSGWPAANITPQEAEAIREKYQDKDIYALTGATISSKSVTYGVRNMVRKFSYRLHGLDDIVASQKVPVAF